MFQRRHLLRCGGHFGHHLLDFHTVRRSGYIFGAARGNGQQIGFYHSRRFAQLVGDALNLLQHLGLEHVTAFRGNADHRDIARAEHFLDLECSRNKRMGTRHDAIGVYDNGQRRTLEVQKHRCGCDQSNDRPTKLHNKFDVTAHHDVLTLRYV